MSLSRQFHHNWNISRMECKGCRSAVLLTTNLIGIYPEWNVKMAAIGDLVAGY